MKSSKQRKYETSAAYVWWLSLAISSAFGYLTESGVFDKHTERPATPVILFFFHIMMAGLGYLVWKGYRWAKVLVLVGLIYGTVTAIYYAFQGQATIPFKSAAGVHTLIQWILALLATTLVALSFMPAKSETGTELS